MATYNTLDPEILDCVRNYSQSGKSISWNYLERVCLTFDDILQVVRYSISIGASFNGNPSPRLSDFLKKNGIDSRKLQ